MNMQHRFPSDDQQGLLRDDISRPSTRLIAHYDHFPADLEAHVHKLLAEECFPDAVRAVSSHEKGEAPTRLALLRAEAFYQMGEFNESARDCLGILDYLGWDQDALNLLGLIMFAQGRHRNARSFFAKVLSKIPGHVAASVNMAFLKASSPPPPPRDNERRAVIATSLPPGNADLHMRAVASWRKLGFDIISLNAQDEIDAVSGTYPHVEFKAASRDARSSFGRPYVYLDDLLSVLVDTGAETLGIVNADIHLVCRDEFRNFLADNASHGLVYGPRVDVNSLAASEGRFYHHGFDYFFFSPKQAQRLPASPFCLGQPWWDLHLPWAFAQGGNPLHLNTSAVAFHKSHEMNYSKPEWYTMGLEFLRRLVPHIEDMAGTGNLDFSRSCYTELVKSVTRHYTAGLYHLPGAVHYADEMTRSWYAPLDYKRHFAPHANTYVVRTGQESLAPESRL
jgi:hypothetical protein